jgi:CBS domain-containing protein
MKRDVKFCMSTASLADAAHVMDVNEVGVLPIINDTRRVLGMITDRDICKAVSRDPRPAAEIPVARVTSGKVFACGPDDDVQTAFKTMRAHRVRRLPVINDEGHLCGILSLDDLVLEAERANSHRTPEISDLDTLFALKAIYRHSEDGKGMLFHP